MWFREFLETEAFSFKQQCWGTYSRGESDNYCSIFICRMMECWASGNTAFAACKEKQIETVGERDGDGAWKWWRGRKTQ